jgi:ABC-type sugar transport system permease subunit
MGYASAMAWLLLIFALVVTWLLLRYTGFFKDDKTGVR